MEKILELIMDIKAILNQSEDEIQRRMTTNALDEEFSHEESDSLVQRNSEGTQVHVDGIIVERDNLENPEGSDLGARAESFHDNHLEFEDSDSVHEAVQQTLANSEDSDSVHEAVQQTLSNSEDSDSVHEAVQQTLSNSELKAIDCLHQHGFQPRGIKSGLDEEGNDGSAIQGELSARTLQTSEVSSLSEKLSDLNSQSDFDSMMGDATDDEEASYIAKNNMSLHPATTRNGTGEDNPLLLNSEVGFGAGDWDEFVREVGGNDFQVTELEAGSNELEILDVREDIGGASKLKAEDDCCGSLGGTADKLVYEDALTTRFELKSLCTISGSGRPDLEEDDSPELLRVKDHFQTVDKFHSGIDNNRNSLLMTNDYVKGDIRLSSELPNSPPHFYVAKEEERNLCPQKPWIQAFNPDGNKDTPVLQASHTNLEDIHLEKELEFLSDTEEMEEKEENCLKCHEPSRQSNIETGMSLVPFLDAKTTYSPTTTVENTVDKFQRVEGNSESFLPWTSEPRDVYFCDTTFTAQVND